MYHINVNGNRGGGGGCCFPSQWVINSGMLKDLFISKFLPSLKSKANWESKESPSPHLLPLSSLLFCKIAGKTGRCTCAT